MNPIFLVIGPPAVGKSTTSNALARCFSRSIHIPVDDIRNLVVSGIMLPGEEWSVALTEQVALARKSAVQMALNYHTAGFTVVIDDFWHPAIPSDYQALIDHPCINKVILFPSPKAAHSRNSRRADSSSSQSYIDKGIQIVYRQLSAALPKLAEEGWVIVDSSSLSVEDTVKTILKRIEIND